MLNSDLRFFCGGTFCFDYCEEGYEVKAAKDYRAELLGSVEALLKPNTANEVKLSQIVAYVGPFYFETENMKDHDIIECEKRMIESCTDAVFLLDDAACPGTITEVIYANSLHKSLHLFYVCHQENEETESELHTPCWYPILFCKMMNEKASLYPCLNLDDAKKRIKAFVQSLK